MIVMSDDARIGYPPARVWGCPTTAMWVYRIGLERAKRMLFTGDLISGREAESMGLVYQSVPADQLDCGRRRTDRQNQGRTKKSTDDDETDGQPKPMTTWDWPTRK